MVMDRHGVKRLLKNTNALVVRDLSLLNTIRIQDISSFSHRSTVKNARNAMRLSMRPVAVGALFLETLIDIRLIKCNREVFLRGCIVYAINFKYLYAVGLLIPHTLANSDTFICPARKAA